MGVFENLKKYSSFVRKLGREFFLKTAHKAHEVLQEDAHNLTKYRKVAIIE